MDALTEAFIELIKSGQIDNDLRAVQAAIEIRNMANSPFIPGASGMYDLGGPWGRSGLFRIGDRVVITDIRPKYLVGQKGVLVRPKIKRWAFRPDNPTVFGRFLDRHGEVALDPSMFKKETP